MRRPACLLAIVVAVSACASSAAAHTPIAFGVGGGNMLPYSVTIQPNGVIRHSGSVSIRRTHLPGPVVRQLRAEIERARLRSRECSGVLPDIGSRYIRLGSRTVRVHGACEPRFTRVWNALAHAVGVRVG